MEFGLSSDI